jgi:1,4-alpha-glucan branching enzyme
VRRAWRAHPERRAPRQDPAEPPSPAGGAPTAGPDAAASAGATPAPDARFAAPITDDDLYLFNEGSHYHLYHKLGCHLTTLNGTPGATFAVWAPNANYVSVIGDFNGWNKAANRLAARGSSGIWEDTCHCPLCQLSP